MADSSSLLSVRPFRARTWEGDDELLREAHALLQAGHAKRAAGDAERAIFTYELAEQYACKVRDRARAAALEGCVVGSARSAYLALREYDPLKAYTVALSSPRKRRCPERATDLHNLGIAIERSGSGQQHRAQALFDEALALRRTIRGGGGHHQGLAARADRNATASRRRPPRTAEPRSEWRKAAGAIPFSSRRHPYWPIPPSTRGAASAASVRARRRGAAPAGRVVVAAASTPAAAPAAAPALVHRPIDQAAAATAAVRPPVDERQPRRECAGCTSSVMRAEELAMLRAEQSRPRCSPRSPAEGRAEGRGEGGDSNRS